MRISEIPFFDWNFGNSHKGTEFQYSIAGVQDRSNLYWNSLCASIEFTVIPKRAQYARIRNKCRSGAEVVIRDFSDGFVRLLIIEIILCNSAVVRTQTRTCFTVKLQNQLVALLRTLQGPPVGIATRCDCVASLWLLVLRWLPGYLQRSTSEAVAGLLEGKGQQDGGRSLRCKLGR